MSDNDVKLAAAIVLKHEKELSNRTGIHFEKPEEIEVGAFLFNGPVSKRNLLVSTSDLEYDDLMLVRARAVILKFNLETDPALLQEFCSRSDWRLLKRLIPKRFHRPDAATVLMNMEDCFVELLERIVMGKAPHVFRVNVRESHTQFAELSFEYDLDKPTNEFVALHSLVDDTARAMAEHDSIKDDLVLGNSRNITTAAIKDSLHFLESNYRSAEAIRDERLNLRQFSTEAICESEKEQAEEYASKLHAKFQAISSDATACAEKLDEARQELKKAIAANELNDRFNRARRLLKA